MDPAFKVTSLELISICLTCSQNWVFSIYLYHVQHFHTTVLLN